MLKEKYKGIKNQDLQNKYLISNNKLFKFFYLYLQHNFVWIASLNVHLLIVLQIIYNYILFYCSIA